MNPIAIIQFPGSNTERETIMACNRVDMKSEEFLWNAPPSSLKNFSGYIIIGGFSYEDRSRAGIIAALDPIMNQIKKESSIGKPVLGICYGALILVESGLVPGCIDNIPFMALRDNKRIICLFFFVSSKFWLWEINENWDVRPVAEFIDGFPNQQIFIRNSFERPSLNLSLIHI